MDLGLNITEIALGYEILLKMPQLSHHEILNGGFSARSRKIALGYQISLLGYEILQWSPIVGPPLFQICAIEILT